ncbi:helix-turn-helix domain-containing protein [Streptomyces sp. NPDC096311]|uniref:helix-turn-helix domain-containing protein n=1 Tax=Streptomyces sp. NPDC096311 TaxID=3366083 RepID=UPI0037F1028A
MTDPKSAPTVLQIVLGRRLAALRETAGLTAAEAAKQLRTAPTTITRMEKAEVALKFANVRALLEIYEVTKEETQEFLALLDQASESGWWQSFRDALPSWFGVYVSLEDAATQVRVYDPQVVPGLLQTEDYARAVLQVGLPRQTVDVVERRVGLRTARQELLARSSEPPPHLWVVMEETALRRNVGNQTTMVAQLDRLLRVAELPNVTLQVCTFDGGLHPGGFGPFTVFRIPELPDIACIDSLSGVHYTEDAQETALYREALDQMAAYALSADDTKIFISDVRKEISP